MCPTTSPGDGIPSFPNGQHGPLPLPPPITRAEFDALKREVEELRDLLAAAMKFDGATDQPHCEADDKVSKLRQMAAIVGVDLDDLLRRMSKD